MKNYIIFTCDFPYFFYGLNCTHNIIRVHYTNEYSITLYGIPYIFRIYYPVFIDRYICYFKTFVFKYFQRHMDCRMFYFRSNYMATFTIICFNSPEDCNIIAFRSSASENNFFRCCIYCICDGLS